MRPLHDLKPRQILVVDDDSDVIDLITTRLIVGGYKVATARNGAEAMRALKDLRPDAMVLDINMPIVDGFGVLEWMRNLSTVKPPTLVLTARHNAQDVAKAIRLGAKDYLAKPFDDRMLLARVARLFRAPLPRVPEPVEL